MKLSYVHVTSRRDTMDIDQFKTLPAANTALGKLLLDLIEEDTWSNEYFVSGYFPENEAEADLLISSPTFPGNGSHQLRLFSKDASTIDEAEKFIVQRCNDWAEVMRHMADSIYRQRESLSGLNRTFNKARHIAAIIKAIGYDEDQRHPPEHWRKNTKHHPYPPLLQHPAGEWENWEMFLSEEFLAFSDLESGRVKVLMTVDPMKILLDLPRGKGGQVSSESLNELISRTPYAN